MNFKKSSITLSILLKNSEKIFYPIVEYFRCLDDNYNLHIYLIDSAVVFRIGCIDLRNPLNI